MICIFIAIDLSKTYSPSHDFKEYCIDFDFYTTAAGVLQSLISANKLFQYVSGSFKNYPQFDAFYAFI